MLGATLTPLATAAPEVRNTSLATVFVDGDVDYFQFAPNSGIPGTIWTITSPSGEQLVLTHATQMTDPSPCRVTLSGVDVPTYNPCIDPTSGTGGTGVNKWNKAGDLDGTPADGTWTIDVQFTVAGNWDSHPTAANRPGPTLFISGKGIHFGANVAIAESVHQTWNWHMTSAGTTWNEPSTNPDVGVLGEDTSNEAPDEDPDDARFFSSAGGGGTFSAFTLGHNAPTNCNGAATAAHNGAWINGEGITTSQWIYRDGDFTGTADLRLVSGSVLTTPELEGDPADNGGTDTEAIPYNNVAGSSRQFIASTPTQGERLGTVVFVPAALCPVTPPTQNVLFTHVRVLEVSQAQCDDDEVSFTIDVDLSTAVTFGDIDLAIYDAITGTLLANFDDAQMLNTQAGQIWYFSEVFPTGSYMAEAVVDTNGVGSFEAFDSQAFNVPRGNCIDTEGDDSPLFTLIALLAADLAAERENTTEHRNGTLEVMAMSFGTIGFDGFLLLLFWAAVWFFGALNRYYLITATATGGLMDTLIPALPLGFVEWVVFTFLAFTLYWWAGRSPSKTSQPGVLN